MSSDSLVYEQESKAQKEDQSISRYQAELAEYLLELEEEESEAASVEDNISIKDQPLTAIMSESDIASAASLRRKLETIHSRTQELKEQLSDQRTEENAAASDYESLQEIQDQLEMYKEKHSQLSESLSELETEPTSAAEDNSKAKMFRSDVRLAKIDSRYLLSARSLLVTAEALEDAVKCLVLAFEAEPGKTHSTAVELVLEISKDLTAELRASPLPERHELKQRAKEAKQQSLLILGRMSKDVTSEVKPVAAKGKAAHKLKYLDVPQFDGRLENWHSFWEEFDPAVHGQEELDDTSKLIYLKQAILDQELKQTVVELSTKAKKPWHY